MIQKSYHFSHRFAPRKRQENQPFYELKEVGMITSSRPELIDQLEGCLRSLMACNGTATANSKILSINDSTNCQFYLWSILLHVGL
jgi:hypothetical protein